MKKLLSLFAVILISSMTMAQNKTFHDFEMNDIYGDLVRLSDYKGKKVLVVNTASACGLTPQYEKLQELYDKYGGAEFQIIGFPANNFGGQEPGTDSEIRSFCTANYGVTFRMMAKISVKGDDIAPLYKWLTTKSENGFENNEVSWNFEKFMIDEAGKLVGSVDPPKKPDCDKIIDWIEGE